MVNKNEKAKQLQIGQVVSDKMDKTVVVRVERTFKHPVLGKIMRSFKKYKVHVDQPLEKPKVGDIVEFYFGRPVSKTKFSYLARVIKPYAVTH